MKALALSVALVVILVARTPSHAQMSYLGGQGGLVQTPFRAGPVAIENNYNNSVVYTIQVYHPQAPGRIYAQWTIGNPGKTNLLHNNQPLRLGSDWGIQIVFGNGVASPIRRLDGVGSYQNGTWNVVASRVFNG
jgi:hypothetical protein